jgi:hypothetical protein
LFWLVELEKTASHSVFWLAIPAAGRHSPAAPSRRGQ